MHIYICIYIYIYIHIYIYIYIYIHIIYIYYIYVVDPMGPRVVHEFSHQRHFQGQAMKRNASGLASALGGYQHL